MAHLKDYITAIDYKVTGGTEFQWRCFGDHARYLDADDCEGSDGTYSINCVFDSQTQTIYMIEAWDYVLDRQYRWIDPDWVDAYRKACKKHSVDFAGSLEGSKFIDLELSEDILEKAQALVRGEAYDERVRVPVEFSDEELLHYMKLAHERDITFNQLIEEALRHAIEEHRRDPEAFEQRAESWKREKNIL